MKKRNTKTTLCAAIGRSREPEKEHISIVRPAQINRPCVLGNVSKRYHILKNFKKF
jgi:hypothetical protein